MKKIALSEAEGLRLDAGSVISRVNVYARLVTVDKGLSASFLSWDQLKQRYGVEICPTSDESDMIERGRLTIQIEHKAKDLRQAIETWLVNPTMR